MFICVTVAELIVYVFCVSQSRHSKLQSITTVAAATAGYASFIPVKFLSAIGFSLC
jgi:hypothetical protein